MILISHYFKDMTKNMKNKIYTEFYFAVTFIAIGIMSIDSESIFPWIFLVIGIISAFFLRRDYKKVGEKEFDKLFGIKDE